MQKQIRYELLREAPAIKCIETYFVAKAIMRSLYRAPAIAVSTSAETSFSIPWWNFHVYKDMILSWGTIKTYPRGEEQAVYRVERRRVEPWYTLRALMRDTDGIPVHSDYIHVGYNLTLAEALVKRNALQEEFGSEWFFDIYPQDK